jgi:hypothetical protein
VHSITAKTNALGINTEQISKLVLVFMTNKHVICAGILNDGRERREPNFVKSLKNCCNFVTESLWCLLQFLFRQYRNWFKLVEQK